MQLVVAPAPLRIWLDKVGWRECHGVVIGPDLAHQLAQTGQAMKMVYLEPERDSTRRIASRLRDGWCELNRAEALALWEQLDQTGLAELSQVVADALCPAVESAMQRHDAPMQRLLDELPRPLPEKITARQLAQAVHLSPSRFQHRFVQHTGMAVRPYLRWLRLLTALTAIARGASLTQGAVEAGFADAAHFSRTFRRHFGFAPRHLLRMHLIG
ncbi:helix-turn-helix transcriptional regulator [Rhodoferax sp.]|uniref:helix-turn-helix transcriptional regulator n=1 Tax=Rhodoferax sp. TaxID=50421 RepID=UPI00276D34F8|nr:helix-turn-helix transcriptional regulator [Rhodoferax sp.]